MSFKYNLSNQTTRDKLRLLIGDTKEATMLFENEELDTLLSINDNVLKLAAASACRILAIDSAKQAIAFTMLNDSIAIDKKSVPKYFIKLAEGFEKSDTDYPIEIVDSMQGGINKFGESEMEMYQDDEI